MPTLDKNRWNRLWKGLCGADAPAGLFQKLLTAYNEPHRAYHTVQHIHHCLEEWDHVRDLARRPDEVEIALWFHDAVYDTHAADNEEKSAAWVRQELLANQSPIERAARIHDLILATKHAGPLFENDAQLTADIDLSSLGQPAPEFLNNERKIRAEYQWVPEKAFQQERTKILEIFLQRKRIYFTDYFEALYGAQARKNLTDAFERLSRQP